MHAEGALVEAPACLAFATVVAWLTHEAKRSRAAVGQAAEIASCTSSAEPRHTTDHITLPARAHTDRSKLPQCT